MDELTDGLTDQQSDMVTIESFSHDFNIYPKGIKWSEVPLPCSSFSLVFMGGGSQPTSGFRPGWLGLRPGWLGLRPGWMAQGGGTYGRTNERTENLPILQDFVPYRGRCPASPHENQGESRAGQVNR